ncbi:MAG: helicase [Bacteriophage sp.]|nr:MAG: helicase [Bacteriophage sp.]
MKIVMSNRLYFKPSEELWEHCNKHTSYQIFEGGSKYPKMFKNNGVVGNGTCWIPTSRTDLLDSMGVKYTLIDKRAYVHAEIPKPTFILRPDQQEIYDQCNDSGIINGNPGFGKTITGLALAYKLQQKTLVICTNTSIRSQWEKEIKKWFGFSPGIIGSGKFNIEPPIVVSNIQTLNKHSNDLSSVFGMIIVDEMHHCVATTFTNFLSFSKARYKLGLSGTLKRKDGLQVMFKDFFGFDIYVPPKNNVVDPTIHSYKIDVELSGNMNVPWADRANDVYSHPIYKQTMFDLCRLYAEMGHSVLFVSDRTNIIVELTDALNDYGIEAEHITGNMKDLSERDEVMERVAEGHTRVVCAAQSIFSEGVSLNELSCLILGSIVNNESLLEQLAGRIQRIVEGKLDPVFVDISLKGGTAFNQAASRKAVYMNNGWEFIHMTPEKLDRLIKTLFANS